MLTRHKSTKFLLLLLSIIVAVMIAAPQLLEAEGPETVEIYKAPIIYQFNGDQRAVPEGQESFISNGSTYVPLRFVAYSLGKAVHWDPDTYTVSVLDPVDAEQAEIDSYNEMNKSNEARGNQIVIRKQKLEVYYERINYMFFGTEKQPDQDLQGFLFEDVLYVPLRFFAESVDYPLHWDAKTYSIQNQDIQNPETADGAPEIIFVDETDGIMKSVPSVKPSSTPKPTPSPTPKPKPSPTPSVTPSPIPVIPVQNSGTKPSTSVKSLSAIQSEIEGTIGQLQNKCSNQLGYVYSQFKSATTQDEKASFISNGYAILASCDAEFDGIMNRLAQQLTDNNHPTTLVDSYRQTYEDTKNSAYASILGG